AGGTALPLRRLPRHVLALPLLPEPGVPQMPWKPDPAMARRASSRTAAVRLFHAVVTVPSELRAVFQRHQKLLYGLLMQVSAAAVKDLCAEKRHLGALPGMLA